MVEDAAKPTAILSAVCAALSAGAAEDARQFLRDRYPFAPIRSVTRSYTEPECMSIFRRDGFVDRYSGRRLVFPGTLRLLSRLLPAEFPFHPNWKADACHFAYYELFPTIDHIVPVTRGGADDPSNWVTTSMLANGSKGNFLLAELGWTLRPAEPDPAWDGLVSWFIDTVQRDPSHRSDRYIRTWYNAALQAAR